MSNNHDISAWPTIDIIKLSQGLANPTSGAALLANYLINNKIAKTKTADSLLKIFDTASRVGHHLWPTQIRDLVAGRRVLDFGSGTTLYGAVFRALGASSYVGVDQRIDLNKKSFRSRVAKGSVSTDVSLTSVLTHIPDVEYYRTLSPEINGSFDVAVLHTVTEHLLDIEGVIETIARSLRPGGTLWFLHDNFYAWAGHHMAPHAPKLYRPDDPEHNLYADWRHITYEPAEDHPFKTNLNRIRIDDLRKTVSKHFTIEEWNEIKDTAQIERRLTPKIEASLKDFTRRDLLTRHVICKAHLS